MQRFYLGYSFTEVLKLAIVLLCTNKFPITLHCIKKNWAETVLFCETLPLSVCFVPFSLFYGF